MSKKNRDSGNPGRVEARISGYMTGVGAKLAGGKPVEVFGVDYTADQLTARFQSLLALYTAANEAHQAASKAVAARDGAQPGALLFLDAFEGMMRTRFGADSPDLQSFGITPKKPARKLTPEQQLAKTEKSRATRAKHEGETAPAAPVPAAPAGTPTPVK